MTLLFIECWFDPIEHTDWAIALYNGQRFLYRRTFLEKIKSRRPVWRIYRNIT